MTDPIKAKIQSLCPDVKCRECGGLGYTVQPSMPDGEPEQIQCNCQEGIVSLAVMLRAIAKVTNDANRPFPRLIAIDDRGMLSANFSLTERRSVQFDLTKDNYDDQAEETKLFIGNLLGV